MNISNVRNPSFKAGVLKLFSVATLKNFFHFSVTLECYNLQWIYGRRTILVNFGNPEIIFGNPKKGCDPQFENRCSKALTDTYTNWIFIWGPKLWCIQAFSLNYFWFYFLGETWWQLKSFEEPTLVSKNSGNI